MTTFTPILNIAQVAANQNLKETTINSGLAILEAAMNDSLICDASAGNVVLTQDQFTRYFMFRMQGNAVARNLDTYPASGGYTGKRFFIVANEGTADVTVRPGGSGAGTLLVASGKIVLMQSDGTTLRAVSSGVARLTDLSDVDMVSVAPSNGDVLKYDSGSSKWVPGAFSSSTFTGLSDTPGSYAGAALYTVRVNATHTALEFHQPVIADVTDFPTFTVANATMLLRIKPDGSGMEWISPSVGGSPRLNDLSNVDDSTPPTDGQIVYWDNTSSTWKYRDNPVSIALAISGLPGASQTVNIVLTDAMKLVASLTASQFFIGTNPAATMTFNLNKIHSGATTAIGSIAFSTLGAPTVTFASPISFAAGDVFQIVCPASPDTTGADPSFNFRGFRL